jgi:hypothetical protein
MSRIINTFPLLTQNDFFVICFHYMSTILFETLKKEHLYSHFSSKAVLITEGQFFLLRLMNNRNKRTQKMLIRANDVVTA